jgi:hypothetical protein
MHIERAFARLHEPSRSHLRRNAAATAAYKAVDIPTLWRPKRLRVAKICCFLAYHHGLAVPPSKTTTLYRLCLLSGWAKVVPIFFTMDKERPMRRKRPYKAKLFNAAHPVDQRSSKMAWRATIGILLPWQGAPLDLHLRQSSVFARRAEIRATSADVKTRVILRVFASIW